MSKNYVLLTGSSTGIGNTTALMLDKSGYHVFAGVRNEKDAQALKSQASERLIPVILDVTKDDQINQSFEFIRNTCGADGLLAVINNSGLNYVSPFEFSDEEKARYLMEVNFFGLFKVSKTFLPLLRVYQENNKKSAKIINIGSIGSTIGLPWESFYHASKFAVLGLSESMRIELNQFNIKVSVILPGGIKTKFFGKTTESIQIALDKLPDIGKKYYEKSLKTFMDVAPKIEKYLSEPEKVANVILKAIQAENPKFEYFVGTDAKTLYAMKRNLPTSLFHASIEKMFNI